MRGLGFRLPTCYTNRPGTPRQFDRQCRRSHFSPHSLRYPELQPSETRQGIEKDPRDNLRVNEFGWKGLINTRKGQIVSSDFLEVE